MQMGTASEARQARIEARAVEVGLYRVVWSEPESRVLQLQGGWLLGKLRGMTIGAACL